MPNFVIIEEECRDHTAIGSQATTTELDTPQVGDIFCTGLQNWVDSGADVALSNGTWEIIDNNIVGSTGLVAFRCTVAGSVGAVTLTATDTWIDTCYAWIRPVNLIYDGFNVADSGGSNVDTLSITTTTRSSDAIFAYFWTSNGGLTWTEDSGNGFTELFDNNHASGRGHTGQVKFSNSGAVVGDASSNSPMIGIAFDFAAPKGKLTISPTGTNQLNVSQDSTKSQITIHQ